MPTVDERVAELLERVRAGALPARTRRPDELNEERVEEFIRTLQPHANAGRVKVLRQEIPWYARRTTRMNYAFEVQGEKPEAILLVAHYDTWGGPGADDNTTGEEILKQYLLADLARKGPPALTHVYLLAGSEECGLIGFLSQLLLAGFFWAVSLSLTTGNFVAAVVALLLGPLLTYRFGVAGSRHYVRTARSQDLERLRAVVSVDSVGEGKLYFPVTTLGANFLRAVLPFRGSDRLDDLLKEIAHGHGIRYNTYLAGGTTDHLSFLEVNRSLPVLVVEGFKRLACALRGRPYRAPFTIPASAIVAMCPGKASAFIVGGKIHTGKDTADRVYPQPLRETLLVLDGLYERLERDWRPPPPRQVFDCHYARLYELSDGRSVAVLKDAVEPNRRNVNVIVTGDYERLTGEFEVHEVLDWGTEESLDREMKEFAEHHKLRWKRRAVDRLEFRKGASSVAFARPAGGFFRALPFLAIGRFQHLLGVFSFAAMFAAAIVLGVAVTWGLELLAAWRVTGDFIADHAIAVILGAIALQLAILARLYITSFPTWIDNAYKNLNRADNLGSLRRVASEPPETA